MARDSRLKLGDILVSEKVINSHQLEKALSKQDRKNKKLGKVLIDMGLTTEAEIAIALCMQLRLKFDDLRETEPEKKALALLDKEFVTKNLIMPIAVKDGELVAAVADPLDTRALDEAAEKCGMNIRPVISTETEIMDCIERNYAINELLEEMLKAFDVDEDAQFYALPQDEEVDVEKRYKVDGSAPVMKMLAFILQDAIKLGASDLFIESMKGEVRMRYRIKGDLVNIIGIHKSLKDTLMSHFKRIANLDVSNKKTSQSGRSKVMIARSTVELEVTTLPTVNGERLNIKLFPRDVAAFSLKDLQMPDADAGLLTALCSKGQGLVLFTGPKGSGKSTTMYALLRELDPDKKDIFAIEERIGIQLDGVTQIELAGKDMADELRRVLRQRPDVILVDELVDNETATIALEAALRGSLVLTSMLTADPAQAVSRLMDLGIPPRLVSSALSGVAAQRLLRLNCDNCKQEYRPDLSLIPAAGYERPGTFYRGKGCGSCHNSGYGSHAVIFETVRITPSTKNLIQIGASEEDLKLQFMAEVPKTLSQSAWDMVVAGKTTVEESLKKVPEDLWTAAGRLPVAKTAPPAARPATAPAQRPAAPAQPPAAKPSAPAQAPAQMPQVPAAASAQSPPADARAAEAGAGVSFDELLTGNDEEPQSRPVSQANAAVPLEGTLDVGSGPVPGIMPIAESPVSNELSDVMRQQKILLAIASVDDEQHIRAKLQQNDYEVISAFSGVNALNLIYSENPDILICDMKLPTLDELISYKKVYDSRRRYIPVISIALDQSLAWSQDEKKLRPDTKIFRPLDLSSLVHEVNQLASKTVPHHNWKVV